MVAAWDESSRRNEIVGEPNGQYLFRCADTGELHNEGFAPR